MLKTIIKSLMAVAAVSMLFSCEKVVPTITFQTKAVSFEAAGGDKTLDFATNLEVVTAKCEPASDWLSWKVDVVGEKGTIKITADENKGTDPRSAELTVGNDATFEKITVTQLGASLSFSIDKDSADVPAEGGSVTVTVTANTSWTVTVANNADWITATPAEGDGNGTISIVVLANPTLEAREGIVGVKGGGVNEVKNVTIKQAAGTPSRLTDSLALVAVYNAADGASWAKNNWDLKTPIDTWNGVTVDATSGRVTALKITASGVITKEWNIPAEVANLTEVTDLRFNQNNVGGTIPEAIFSMTKLQKLYLQNNKLTGELSSKFTQLTELSEFYIDRNANLGGSLPSSIGNLKNLKSLNISVTSIGGAIPQELSQCTALANLMAYSNKLSGEIPDFWDKLPNVGVVQLYGNPGITGPIPATMGSLKTATGIQLKECNLTGNIPASFGGLEKCGNLQLNGNKLQGVVPAEVQAHPKWLPTSGWKYETNILPQQEGYGLTLGGGDSGISTADALLAWLADGSTDATLSADIDLTGKTITPAAEITGSLDGNGKTITVKDLATPVIAVTKGAVKNVTFVGSFKGTPGDTKFVLAPIGKSYGSIENVTNRASVTVTGPAAYDAEQNGGALVAGVAGEAYGQMKGCKNEGKVAVDCSGKDTGSIIVAGVVSVAGAAVDGCDNSGEVSLIAGSPLGRTKGLTEVTMKYAPVSSVAGVVTYAVSDANHAVTVSNCNNTGKISFTYDNINASSFAVSRSPVCGVVANSGGDITNCHNKGDIYGTFVAATRGAAITAPNIILHASGVQGADYFVKKIKGKADQNETSVIDCSNSGKIIVDSDLTASNNTAGGVCAWPAAESASVTVIKNCVNSGDITVKGLSKIRVGGIAGGTNSIEGCKNSGNIFIEGADAASVVGLINGFHTQTHTLKNCEASGKIESAVKLTGIGGLCGGIGNVENTVCEGCKVNATLTGGETAQIGLIVGTLNGNTKKVTIGTAESPVTVAGSVNGTAATADNFMTLIHNATNYTEGMHIFNVVFGN